MPFNCRSWNQPLLATLLSLHLFAAQAQTQAPAVGNAANDASTQSAAIPGAAAATRAAGGPQATQDPTKADKPLDALLPEPTRPKPSITKAPALPTQFQRFVLESTGRLLPTFGRELFDAPQSYAPDNALPTPADYSLGVGDEVRLQVTGPIDFAANVVLDRNGQVNIPKVGAVTLAGVRAQELEAVLKTQLARVFANFQVNATPGRLRGIQVYVVGQAQQPGTYHLSSLSTLVNALFASGGPGPNGSMRAIELKRAGKTLTTLDLYDFISRGDKSRDIPLLSGDVIVIPPAGPRVAVTGALDQAAIYELKPISTSIADILALSGGVPSLAKTQKALLERITPGAASPRQVQEIVLDANGARLPLRDGDVLTLLPISPAFSNAVTLQGVVAEPLRYRWFEGMKVLDLIPERDALITPDYYRRKNLLVQSLGADKKAEKEAGAGVDTRVRGMVDQINWDYAVVERLDPVRLATQLIPFNLGRAVLAKDPTHNLTLLAGDIVTVFSQTDLRLPQDRLTRLVRIEGEVAAPGLYQMLPGETLPQIITRVGGVTPQAYLFGTEFNRESVRQRQQENLDRLIRRLESQTSSQAAKLAANKTDAAAQAQLLAQEQSKQQLDRLRSLKSSGRMALELEAQITQLATLPNLPLEDGDRILIPSRPGYVAAYGSVNNENVFIYKPGKTVADVIRSAGLTEDAEPDQAFVLRADGSIIARRDTGGLFSGSFEATQLMPGDALVVPAQIDRESKYNIIVRGFKDWTQILSNLGLGVAALRTITN